MNRICFQADIGWGCKKTFPLEDIVKTNWMIAWTIGAVLLGGTIAGVTTASGQKTAGSSSGGKQWLAAMDADHDGTVSKQEFTTYMSAQFDKADIDHDGTLNADELEQLRKNLAIATKQ
jgi:hypothetical protein